MIAEMRMLLWKDFRLSRLCIIAGIIFTIIPYLLLIFPYFFSYFTDYSFETAWVASAFVSQLAMAFIAGNIIACERADRSAAFLAYQGASRKMIVTSKMLFCTIVLVSICAISFILSFWIKLKPYEIKEVLKFQIFIAAIGFCFLGGAWLLSNLFPSPVPAIVFGILSPICIFYGLSMTAFYFHWPVDSTIQYWYTAFNITAGLISLVAGTWHFIRSKES